jgi:hypothetical protein
MSLLKPGAAGPPARKGASPRAEPKIDAQTADRIRDELTEVECDRSRAAPLAIPAAKLQNVRARVKTIRVENMPVGAELSAGKNNWDHTWSLTPEDLRDLYFFPPQGRRTETDPATCTDPCAVPPPPAQGR